MPRVACATGRRQQDRPRELTRSQRPALITPALVDIIDKALEKYDGLPRRVSLRVLESRRRQAEVAEIEGLYMPVAAATPERPLFTQQQAVIFERAQA